VPDGPHPWSCRERDSFPPAHSSTELTVGVARTRVFWWGRGCCFDPFRSGSLLLAGVQRLKVLESVRSDQGSKWPVSSSARDRVLDLWPGLVARAGGTCPRHPELHSTTWLGVGSLGVTLSDSGPHWGRQPWRASNTRADAGLLEKSDKFGHFLHFCLPEFA
jgi:hypothetical protein